MLVSRESAHHHGRTPLTAIGTYLTIIGLAPVDSGVWVATMGRWVSTVIMISFVLVVVHSFDKTTFPWKLAIITGILDSTANGLFQMASQRGVLSIDVNLARVVIKERMNRVQSVGVLLALSAAVLLAFNSS